MKKIGIRNYYIVFILMGAAVCFQTVHTIPDVEAWDHYITPNVINEDLFLEEDLTLQTDQVLIQVSTQDCEVTSDCSVRIHGYPYKPAEIDIYTLNGFNVLFDVTENGLHFKGGTIHHTFKIQKIMGEGMVQFTVGNGRHLRFAPKKD